MPETQARERGRRLRSRARAYTAGLAAMGIGVLCWAQPAAAAAVKPTVPAGFTITKVADAPKGAANCDDLAFLDGNLFMGCQNKTLSNGGGGNSTLVEFSPTGTVVNTWSIKDKIDGLGADPLKHYVILTLDEDANSHLARSRRRLLPASRSRTTRTRLTHAALRPRPRCEPGEVPIR